MKAKLVKTCYVCGTRYPLSNGLSDLEFPRFTLTIRGNELIHKIHCCSIECVRTIVNQPTKTVEL